MVDRGDLTYLGVYNLSYLSVSTLLPSHPPLLTLETLRQRIALTKLFFITWLRKSSLAQVLVLTLLSDIGFELPCHALLVHLGCCSLSPSSKERGKKFLAEMGVELNSDNHFTLLLICVLLQPKLILAWAIKQCLENGLHECR